MFKLLHARCSWTLVAGVVFGLCNVAFGDGPSQITFSRDIAPILARQCQTCHGPDKAKGKYRVDTFARLTKSGGSDDAPIVAGKPQQSALYKRLIAADEDDRMPQKADPLTKAQIAMFREWIEQGAKFDGPDPAASLGSLLAQVPQPAPPGVYPKPIPITALAFSPDGKTLAASGYHEITLWEAASGHPAGRIANMPERVLGLAYSPDGHFLAAVGGSPGSQGELRIVDLNDGRAVKLLERISDVMTCVRFSPDGSHVAAGGADNAIRVYDVASGKRELFIEQHADWITDLAYSPDGSKIASASRDKSSRVFELPSGAMIGAYIDSEEPLLAVAWSDDGKRAFVSSRDHHIHAWTVVDSKKIGAPATQPGDTFRLESEAGLLYATSADGAVRIFNQKDRTLRRELGKLDDWAYGLTVSREAHLIAAGGYDGSVHVWDKEDGREVLSFVASPGR